MLGFGAEDADEVFNAVRISVSVSGLVKRCVVVEDDVPCFRGKSALFLLELLLAGFPDCGAFVGLDGLDPEFERCADWTVIRGSGFVSSVFKLLHPAYSPIQDTITPCGRAFLVASVVVIGAHIILICRCKRDRSLDERSQTETWVLAS